MGLRKKWHGVGTKVGGLAYRGDLTYALNCIFSLKICIFRLEMDFQTGDTLPFSRSELSCIPISSLYLPRPDRRKDSVADF